MAIWTSRFIAFFFSFLEKEPIIQFRALSFEWKIWEGAWSFEWKIWEGAYMDKLGLSCKDPRRNVGASQFS